MPTPSAVVFGCGQKTVLSRRICPPAALVPGERPEDWNGRGRLLHDRRARRHMINGQLTARRALQNDIAGVLGMRPHTLGERMGSAITSNSPTIARSPIAPSN